MTKNTFRDHLIVLVGYAVLALVMTWPVVTTLGTHVAGDGGDPWQTLWRFESTEMDFSSAISSGEVGNYLREEFLGGGNPRLVNLAVWPWMPLHIIFGEPLGYNLVWLLSFILSGYGAFLLVRFLVGSETAEFVVPGLKVGIPMAAFLAGVVYMLLPFRVAHAYGHFGAMQTQWLPLIILAWLALWRRPSLPKALGFSLLLIMQAWTEHHYILLLSLFFLIWMLMHMGDVGRQLRKFSIFNFQFSKSAIGGLMVIFLLVFLLLSLLPTLRLALEGNSTLDLGRDQLVRFSADLFSFVVPAPFHSVWGGVSDRLLASSFTGNLTEATHNLGLVSLLLVVFFYRQIPNKQRRFWTLIGFVFFAIALGPRLHIFGRVTGLPLPYEIIDSWPVISSVRAVARASIFVGLSSVVLLGFVLSKQLKRSGIGLLLGLVILFEFLLLPVPVQSTQLSDVYTEVAGLPGSRIVEIPATTNYKAASQALYASVFHGKEVFGNIALERAEDPEVLRLSRSVPALRQLLFARTTDLRERRLDFFAQDLAETLPDALRWVDVGGIVVHTDSLSELQVAAIARFLEEGVGLVPESFVDALLYRVDWADLASARGSDGVFLMRDSGWENVGFDPARGSIFAEVSDTARITVVNVKDSDVVVRLQFGMAPESAGRAIITSSSEFVTEVESEAVVIETTLSPGEHEFVFEVTGLKKVIIQDPQLTVR